MAGVAIIGTTTWGVTLGVVLARNGIDVRLWARTEQECLQLQNGQHRADALAGITLPPQLSITTSLPEALDDADAVILAVPSQRMRDNIKAASGYLKGSMLVVSAAKGLEITSNKRMSQVIADEISPSFWPNICVHSGPNLSAEILQGLPAVAVVAAWNELIARKVQKLLNTPSICLYTNSDVIGVELGGALKNIIALGAGIADGLGFGDNAKAALITRGLTEMTALGLALGANPLTFSGLTGLGDLVTTCSSPLSRNHYVGVELTKGRPLEEILKSMSGVAEGVSTTIVAHKLSKQFELEMPITERIYKVLYQGLDPRKASLELMEAEARHELMGRRWRLFSLFRH
ncbi:MAG: NAD(P)-dependent glycerol-3-phosphate dehydrogenase [Chloroflexi bacterium]|jgi:glycerol-3-phosphate dehydrogenase (NAD(P)+)|nr:NAD(P)-dependent glycerol-3-phosphate dehydrogenase [Chloroflexota bacterium]